MTFGSLGEWVRRLRRHDTLGYFAASSVALNGATLLAGVVTLRWIPPELMGIWQLMILAESYSAVIKLGIPNALNRELPFLLGQGEEERGRQAAATAQFQALITGAVVFAGFAVAGILLGSGQPGWQAAAFTRAVAAGTGHYLGYLLGTYRSKESFRALSGIQFGQAAMALLMPVFAYFWGFDGLCVHGAAQSVVLVGLAHRWRPLHLRPAFSREAWSLLWKTGLHLCISSYLITVTGGLEKVFLAWRGTVEMVGLYSPALAVIHAMAIVPAALATYVYPRMSYRFGQTQAPGALGRMTFLTMALALALSAPLVLVGWFALPPFVEALAPQYAPALPAMRLALVTGVFLAGVSATTVLRALKSWKLLYLFIGLAGIAKLAALAALVRGDDPLMGAAWGGLVAAVVSLVATGVVCALATRSGVPEVTT